MNQLPLITGMLLLASPAAASPQTPLLIFALAVAGLVPALLRRG
ncbi:MAG: hypothetical protein WCO11_02180 [Sphingomonadales bacterium]|jgi:hypothetical protein